MDHAPKRRLASMYNLDEAQLLLDDIPSDSDVTDEEPDSDSDDPTFQPDPLGLQIVDIDAEDDSHSNDDEAENTDEQPDVPSTSRAKKTPEPKRHWKKKDVTAKLSQFDLPEGPIVDHFADNETPGDYFLQYLDESIRHDIIYQTNLYINQRQRHISPVTNQEFLGFIGINFIMGYHKLPSWTDYWKTDQDLTVPLVASTMPRNRFGQILSNLHVNDNNNIPANNTDKLYKLRPLIAKMNQNYVKLYNISQRVSVDESMILFKGRHSIKQYNPKKPIKRGYKLWMRADSDGYITKFDVYQGKSGGGVPDETLAGFGLGERVIIDMTQDLFGRHHEVYFDNYFSSVPLMEYLKANDVRACGTIRVNRKGLPEGMVMDKALERGQFDHRASDQDLVYFKWMDNRGVHVISNFHGTDKANVTRKQKDGTSKEFPCPKALKDYNSYMGGVDKADMYCAVHGLGRKSKKWWHRIFFGILDRTLCNAQIAYNKNLGKKLSTLDFRRSVAQTFVVLARPPRVGRPLTGRTTPPAVVNKRCRTEYSVDRAMLLHNRGVHWVVYGKQRGRCEVCSTKKIESRPHSKCDTCGVFLCSNEKKNCFLEFHGV